MNRHYLRPTMQNKFDTGFMMAIMGIGLFVVLIYEMF